ncbi:hypothetical protein pipiens_008741 [Culex pipiens pipiens]|uniref:Uncharacterized protein n=1 Tax=Culex pipiens pipiens TaxID=38569 RepID=A0ABD1DGM6_CULPP
MLQVIKCVVMIFKNLRRNSWNPPHSVKSSLQRFYRSCYHPLEAGWRRITQEYYTLGSRSGAIEQNAEGQFVPSSWWKLPVAPEGDKLVETKL